MTEKQPRSLRNLDRRTRLVLSFLPALALLLAAVLAPLPFAVAQPGITADVLGEEKGKSVISVPRDEESGEQAADEQGRLLLTTIAATAPEASVRIGDVASGWFDSRRAVMPRAAVYPEGESVEEIEEHNASEMKDSQDAAVDAALRQLGRAPGSVDVTLRLADVGGPSAGLLFSLGIIDKLEGDGAGGNLTGGRTVAGTGTIDGRGKVGAVGGVPLKTQAAKRDGASVFLVPKAECQEARAELPDGLRLVPVATLDGALDALSKLRKGENMPTC
ncbi:S16 family serine protease [Streptomyces sulphureus]|uniref:S16 family serine protease n=1 Tax=Streptomyces sulphureus TaxID=47758 RepID=UPI00037E40F2